MIVDRQFHNIQCDHCGALIDEETEMPGDRSLTSMSELENVTSNAIWFAGNLVRKLKDKEF